GAVLALLTARVLGRRLALLPVALSVLSAGVAVAAHFGDTYLVSGLLGAFPVLAAVVLLKAEDLRTPLVAALLGTSVLTAVGITLTLYEGGGASEWGGRFYHLLLPLLCPVVVLALDRTRAHLPLAESRVLVVAVAVVALVVSA